MSAKGKKYGKEGKGRKCRRRKDKDAKRNKKRDGNDS